MVWFDGLFERGEMDSNSLSMVITNNSELVSSLVDIICAVIYAIATCFAAGVGIWGVRSWRIEFRGKRQIELAEDALELFYNTGDAITAVRYPISDEGEGSTRKAEEKETEDEKKYRDRAHVAYERLKEHKETFNKLYAMRYRFMARIGKDKAKPFEQIHKIVSEILVAAQMLPHLWVKQQRRHTPKTTERLQGSVDRLEAIFWYSGSEDNINKRVAKAIADIEQTCKSILAEKMSKNNN